MDKVKIGDIVRTQYDDYGKVAQETSCFFIDKHRGKMYEVQLLSKEEETEWLYDDEIIKCGRIESTWQKMRAPIFNYLKKLSKGRETRR